MKKQTSKLLEDLTADILDYMFVEWLTRRCLYSKFVKNLAHYHPDSRSSRSTIRGLIRAIPSLPAFSASDLIWISFPFCGTPEGSRFWARVSYEWSSYLKFFSKII